MARMHWKKVGVESELRRKDIELKCNECHKYFFGKYLAFHKSVVHSEDAYAYKCKIKVDAGTIIFKHCQRHNGPNP